MTTISTHYHWCVEQIMSALAYLVSVPQRFVRNAHGLSPFLQTARYALELVHRGSAAIADLLQRCRPSAVVRFVVPFVVNAIESSARWTRTHVREEVGELIPSRADLDASTTVLRESSIVWIAASLAHGGPRVKLGCTSETVLKTRFPFAPQAAARKHSTMNHVVPKYLSEFTAVAAKEPTGLVVAGSVFNTPNPHQAPKALTS